ncbi:fimbrial protein BcfF [Raoultella terrigena]|uniref:Fimbrial protein BcfF n=1 Tax=Raoultella terrigena TaxID=577 RepID=A0A4U9D6T1_RAOTE|nr:fimbrial protein BcfF [Raoultella terrigena]
MKWTPPGWLVAGALLMAASSLQAADVTITVNGKVVAKPCTVSTTNATVELGDLYTFSLVSAGAASAWHSVALDLSNCPIGTSRVVATFSGTADGTGYYKTRAPPAISSSSCRTAAAPR